MYCRDCDNRGAVRVQYRSGEPFDVGLCSCVSGVTFRGWLERYPQLIENYFKLPLERVQLLEDLLEGELPAPSETTTRDILVAAGKVDRAGLGGKVKKR